MLDDLKLIHERDAQDALGIAEKQGGQLLTSLPLQGQASFTDIENIVYAGMGGSALAASLIPTWPGVAMPFEVIRNYDLPSYVGPRTLVIVASYSGNTEEALSALEEAKAKQAQIVIIAGGGKLQDAAETGSLPWVQLPKAAQPRYAVLYNFRALLDILTRIGLLDAAKIIPELEQAATFLSKQTANWRPDVATANNPAKQLAQELIGKSIVVYGGPKLFPAAYKWKISFNENAKHVAWFGEYPEFNHNEFLGWSKQPTDKPYAVIDLRSSLEHPRVQKRFEVTARLLSGMRPEAHVVEAEGQTMLEQLLWTIAFGDFVSLYLAILNGLNPAPVDLIEKFKKELNN
jgi:glucose/mannose-6-phosphate isomerase